MSKRDIVKVGSRKPGPEFSEIVAIYYFFGEEKFSTKNV